MINKNSEAFETHKAQSIALTPQTAIHIVEGNRTGGSAYGKGAMKNKIILLVSMVFITSLSWSQDNSRGEASEMNANSVGKYPAHENKKPDKSGKISRRKFKKTYLYWFYDHHEKLREDFYKRKRKLRKGYRKMARIMNKPQYRDHAYFGHKRKPKIREVGKRKFCDECGIVH